MATEHMVQRILTRLAAMEKILAAIRQDMGQLASEGRPPSAPTVTRLQYFALDLWKTNWQLGYLGDTVTEAEALEIVRTPARFDTVKPAIVRLYRDGRREIWRSGAWWDLPATSLFETPPPIPGDF